MLVCTYMHNIILVGDVIVMLLW